MVWWRASHPGQRLRWLQPRESARGEPDSDDGNRARYSGRPDERRRVDAVHELQAPTAPLHSPESARKTNWCKWQPRPVDGRTDDGDHRCLGDEQATTCLAGQPTARSTPSGWCGLDVEKKHQSDQQ
jgi:hypothetical protein